MKRPILILAVLLVCVCVVCIGAVVAFGGAILVATQPVVDAGDAFMTALQNEDYEAAYALCSPALQSEIGAVENLQTLLEQGGVAPTSWSFSSRSIENNTGSVSGTATMEDGSTLDVALNFTKSGDDWLVEGFDFTPQ